MKNLKYIVVDLFCGAGGTTIGFESAKDSFNNKVAKVIGAINHDPVAIQSHWTNHQDVEHFEEDITSMYGSVISNRIFISNQMRRLQRIVGLYRALYPGVQLILWASLECTNFSNAKGGQSRDADSRTLARHLDRYIELLNPEIVQIENVVEFKSWGPLKIKAKKSKVNGFEVSELKIRKEDQHKIVSYSWEPESKHSGRDWLNWKSDLCERFDFKDAWKELNSADFGAFTSRNRLFGLFVKKGEQFIWPEPTHSKKGCSGGLFGKPLKKWRAVESCIDYSQKGKSIIFRKKPLSTNTLRRHYDGLIKHVAGMTKEEFNREFYLDGKVQYKCSFTAKSSSFLSNYHGTGDNTKSIGLPAGAIVAADIHSVVFIDHQFTGEKNHQSIFRPLWSQTTNPSASLIQVFKSKAFIFNSAWFGCNTSILNPAPVIVASQDKAPLRLIKIESGQKFHQIYVTDSPIVVKIKEFMNIFGLSDITMRMLVVDELKLIQGFPSDYILHGTQTDQKKFIGNSVQPGVVKFWIEEMTRQNTHLAAA